MAELVSYLSIVPHMRFSTFDVPPTSAPLTRGFFFAARLPVSRTAAGPRTAPRHGIGNHLPLPAFALLGRNVERFSANGWLGRNVERPPRRTIDRLAPPARRAGLFLQPPPPATAHQPSPAPNTRTPNPATTPAPTPASLAGSNAQPPRPTTPA